MTLLPYVICTVNHIKRSPDLTAASVMKLTQTISQKQILKWEKTESKLKRQKKQGLNQKTAEYKFWLDPCTSLDEHLNTLWSKIDCQN